MRYDTGDLSGDVGLLKYNLDCARDEIHRLRGGKLMLKFAGPGKLPTKAYEGDAGFDLYTHGDWWVGPGEFVDIDVGMAVQLPPGVWAMIAGRSSTLRRRGMLVAQGIIDNGYRGSLYAGVRNLGDEAQHVQEGERIAQLIPFQLTAAALEVVRVPELEGSDRGERGFGSTGI